MENKSEVFLMDCIEGMKQYPDNYFDLAVVDPPYGINFGSFNRTNKDSNGNRYKANKYENGNWDLSIPQMEYFTELYRVSKNQVIWGGNYFDLPPTQCFIFWYKQNPVDNFSDGKWLGLHLKNLQSVLILGTTETCKAKQVQQQKFTQHKNRLNYMTGFTNILPKKDSVF